MAKKLSSEDRALALRKKKKKKKKKRQELAKRGPQQMERIKTKDGYGGMAVDDSEETQGYIVGGIS